MTEITRLAENIYRVRYYADKSLCESLLTKYKLIYTTPEGEPQMLYRGEEKCAVFERGYILCFTLEGGIDSGFSITLPLDRTDRLFGLGDESRDCLEKHGKIAVIKQENVRSPVLSSFRSPSYSEIKDPQEYCGVLFTRSARSG